MEQGIFYTLAAFLLIFSILTVTTTKILRAAVYLLFVLTSTAGIYFMLNYNFLAAVQLTVYAGGIVVLIIFSILLTHQINLDLPSISKEKVIWSAIASIGGIALIVPIIINHSFKVTDQVNDASIQTIGTQLLSYTKNGYVLPFEVISILLLAVMVGAIIIAKRGLKEKES